MQRYQIRGLFFEQLVRRLIMLSGYQRVSTGFVPGRGEEHQIDAFGKYQFSIPFVYPIRLICEAKWLDNGVHLNHVRDFEGVIKDISENYFAGRGIPGRDFVWRLLNRYCDCGTFFSATYFTDRAQNYAYAQGIFLVPYDKNSICGELLKNLDELINSHSRIFRKRSFNVAEDREKLIYSKIVRKILTNSRELSKAFSQIGAYLGMLDGVYPVHVLSKKKIEFDLRQKDDFPIWIQKNRLDISETSLHFEFEDERRNLWEFTLPCVIGRGLINTVKKFYGRRAFSYIDIPVIMEAEGGQVRRMFKTAITPESTNMIHERLAR